MTALDRFTDLVGQYAQPYEKNRFYVRRVHSSSIEPGRPAYKDYSTGYGGWEPNVGYSLKFGAYKRAGRMTFVVNDRQFAAANPAIIAEARRLFAKAYPAPITDRSTLREYFRAKQRRQRERARASGQCIVCCTRPARDRKVTCQGCNDTARSRQITLAKTSPL